MTPKGPLKAHTESRKIDRDLLFRSIILILLLQFHREFAHLTKKQKKIAKNFVIYLTKLTNDLHY